MSSLIKKAGPIRLLCMLLALAQPGWLYADNSAGTCGGDDNTTVNEDANNTCYTISPPESAGAIDVTDGAETGAEWTGAKSKNLQGTMTGTLKVLRSGSDALYLLITANDSTYQASDVISVYFDVQHNHGTTSDDVQLHIKRDNGGSPNHEKFIGGVSAAWNPATLGSGLGRNDSGGAWTVELKLTAAELGVSDLPAIVGFGVSAFNLPTSTAASWPVNFDDTVPATTWANLKNRFPIEYMMVLDQSGSMLDPSVSGGSDRKWDIALSAADYLANAIGILRNTAYFSDQLCAATFAWNCSGGDITAIAKSCATVPSFPAGNYTAGLVEPVWENCTPIGSGLDIGFNTLGTSASEETQRVMLFLSDGMHNRPDSSLTPNELDYSACGSSWTSCTNSAVQVNTVALGQGGGIVDEALLSQVKDHFSGNLHTTYNITNNPTDLKEAFIGSLDELYRMNFVYSGSPASDFTVDEDNQRLIVVASWNTPASASTFKLQRDTGGGAWADVSCNTSDDDTTVGFAVCAVNNPEQGQWRARTTGNANLSADGMFVLMDLNLRARFLVEQAVHGTGMDIILTADLNQGGLPLTNDATHPVTVKVDIEKPDQGMGTFLSTTDPATCKRVEPTVPRVSVDNNKVYVSQAQQPGVSVAAQPGVSSATTAATSSGSGDPATAHLLLAQQLLDACNLDHLPRNVLASLQLVDDGTQGDVTANDGVYSLRFNNTEFEGSYIFRFSAAGKTLNGNAFTRAKASAEYVRVEVDPASSGSGTQPVSQSGTVITQLHYVIPRDRFGGYMGPGRVDQVKFIVSGAQTIGDVLDFNNGIYGQVIRFDSRISTPVVIPVVQDKPVVDKKTICGMEARLWWLVIALALLALVLLWLLIQCRRSKRGGY